MLRHTCFAALALTTGALAQTTFFANTSTDNGLTVGSPALFFDFTAASSDLSVTYLATASDSAPGSTFELELFTRAGSGLGGPVESGPGSSPAGWTSLGVITATQGAYLNGQSLGIDIPNIFVRAGQTVGIALVYLHGGLRCTGLGSNPPQVFGDGQLTLTTGDARSEPFTTGGTWFQSRGLRGAVTYAFGNSVGSNYCSPGAPNSTGSSGTIRAVGSAFASRNELALVAERLSHNAFGFFLTSRTPFFLPQAGGSVGNLCVAGNIGRYVGPGGEC
jgi:hypothetical protein